MGSCFSDAMGERFAECGFDVLSNPFGTLYNPLSVAECLKRGSTSAPLTSDDIIFHNGLWHSWLHHGSFSNPDRLALLANCNEAVHKVSLWLKHPSLLLFTFGTAYVFRHAGRIVANCHKLPATQFERSSLTVDEIIEIWQPLLQSLRREGHQVLFTVSPIRHLADGAHGNQLSKATLLLAIEQLCSDGLAEYFPAYEILLDELRDYRFYSDDLCHPSALAERIVWQHFQETYMEADTLALCDKHLQLARLKQHRPMRNDTPEYTKYKENISRLERELSQR